MPAIYDRPVRVLMRDMVTDLGVQKGQVIPKRRILTWFKEKYPKIKESTITCHLCRMSVNAPSRVHYGAKPGGDDLFFQLDGGHYRLYDADSDPAPIYEKAQVTEASLSGDAEEGEDGNEFAYESDLRDFLAQNLQLIEPGLQLYRDEEGITGIEFPAGKRFIDILALDSHGNYVVIELKVSRGYDRVVGQLLRYMGWVAKNHAEPGQKVRGIIVARDITDDLKLACSELPNIELYEYKLSVSLQRVRR